MVSHLTGINAKFLLFSGKGGVGKTTCAAATAVHYASLGRKTLLFSTDPAHSLSDILGQEISDDITDVKKIKNLAALELNAEKMLSKFKEEYGEEILNMLTTTTYLDEDDIDNIYRLTIPGLDEMMGLKQIMDFMKDSKYDLYIWDTAPTGHTLRLLALPNILDDWIKVLARMRWKYRYIVGRFSRRDIFDETDDFLLMMKKTIRQVGSFLRTPERNRFIAVTIPEAMAINETKRMFAALKSYGIPVRHLIINNVVPENRNCNFCMARRKEQQRHLQVIYRELGFCRIVEVPLLVSEVKGLESLKEVSRYCALLQS
ncbi:ArsA family ATPase [Desulfofundulus sp. TPOSR]|uniref:ArsA family ATPase n=1 Tax=Desulfofundulus sp. TPOSR TaxID=2714340 RepID=UPI00140A00F9|nr:ArsA family ATPase [Desulfofundulus sp. TPOSR]NHM26765.1 ArsA family ATPase [Desulfofundulus sp. TPOSR]